MQNASAVSQQHADPWRGELSDLVRGLSGGFLFGIPLLYTMEVWWLGTHVEPWRLLVLLLLSFAVNWMLSHFAGFHEELRAAGAVTEALEAMAIGIVAAGTTLLMLGEVRPGMPLQEIVGKITLESVPFSLGVSIANGLLRGTKADPKGGNGNGAQAERGGGQQDRDGAGNSARNAIDGTLLDAGATIAGALFIASSIAPTEEVPMLTGQISPVWMVGLTFFSLLVSYGITFHAGFANQEARLQQTGFFQRPLGETVFSYLLSLVVAAVLLWVFKQLELTDPWHLWLERTIVLGLPATIGGSAGRLAVGG